MPDKPRKPETSTGHLLRIPGPPRAGLFVSGDISAATLSMLPTFSFGSRYMPQTSVPDGKGGYLLAEGGRNRVLQLTPAK